MWKQTLGNYFFQPCTNLLKIIKKKRTLQGSWQKKSHVDWIIIERVVIFWMWKENKKCEWKACKHDEHIWENATRQFVKCLRPDSNRVANSKWAPLSETPRFTKWGVTLWLVAWRTNTRIMQTHGYMDQTRVCIQIFRVLEVLHTISSAWTISTEINKWYTIVFVFSSTITIQAWFILILTISLGSTKISFDN